MILSEYLRYSLANINAIKWYNTFTTFQCIELQEIQCSILVLATVSCEDKVSCELIQQTFHFLSLLPKVDCAFQDHPTLHSLHNQCQMVET